MNKAFKIIRDLFQCTNYIEVNENNNTITIVIHKHLSKVSINCESYSIHIEKSGNNRTAKTTLTISMNSFDNEVIHNLIRELTLIIRDNYKSIEEIKQEVKL